MASNPIIQNLYFRILENNMFDFDKADAQFLNAMSTWTLERGLLVQRICELKGEQDGVLSKPSLDTRYDHKIELLRQDMMRR